MIIFPNQSSFENAIAERLHADIGEKMIGAYPKANFGYKPDKKPFACNWLLSKQDSGHKAIILIKFQDMSGSTQDKLIYDFIKLSYVMETNSDISKSWIIIAGNGWSKTFVEFLNTSLRKWIPRIPNNLVFISSVEMLNEQDFSDF